MKGMLVSLQDIREIADQCNGEVRVSDADGSGGALFIQVDAKKSPYDRERRAYIGDMIVPAVDGGDFVIVKSEDIASL